MKTPLNSLENFMLTRFFFLEKDFEFEIINKLVDRNNVYILYQNQTSAIKIGYEPRDRGVFVLLMRLIDGKVPSYPMVIHKSKPLNCFYLDDLLDIRKIDSTFLNPTHKNDIKDKISKAAEALRKHAGAILKGDFKVFLKLEKIVRERAKNLECCHQ